jgi:hypothetical protein
MWTSTLGAWLGSVSTVAIISVTIQDFDGIVKATCTNNWAEYLVQLIGPNGAVAILSLLWINTTCSAASRLLSGTPQFPPTFRQVSLTVNKPQRVTYAIARDGVLFQSTSEDLIGTGCQLMRPSRSTFKALQSLVP